MTDPAPPNAPWVYLKEVAVLMGIKYNTAKNLIYMDKFPMPVSKIGRFHVVHREVLDTYFDDMRRKGLKALRSAALAKARKADLRRAQKGKAKDSQPAV
jgi:hypothetical protein